MFHSSVELGYTFSKFFIILNPKNRGPSTLNDFHPISLLELIHKLIAFVLTSRLHQVRDSLVSFTQTAFILDQNIYDEWISTSQVVNIRNRSRIIFKLDFDRLMIELVVTSFGSSCARWVLGIDGSNGSIVVFHVLRSVSWLMVL